jgi:hypothetical protein
MPPSNLPKKWELIGKKKNNIKHMDTHRSEDIPNRSCG